MEWNFPYGNYGDVNTQNFDVSNDRRKDRSDSKNESKTR